MFADLLVVTVDEPARLSRVVLSELFLATAPAAIASAGWLGPPKSHAQGGHVARIRWNLNVELIHATKPVTSPA